MLKWVSMREKDTQGGVELSKEMLYPKDKFLDFLLSKFAFVGFSLSEYEVGDISANKSISRKSSSIWKVNSSQPKTKTGIEFHKPGYYCSYCLLATSRRSS